MGWAVIISRRPAPLPLLRIPGARQAQSNPNAASDLAADYGGGRIALEWEAPTQGAASIPGTPQVGGTLTADIPDATGTTCWRSDEDDGTSTNARVPFPDHRDRQETPAGDPVAYPMGPRQAPQDSHVTSVDPALGVTWPPPVAGDQMPVLRYRAQSHRVQSRKAGRSCLETHSSYRASAGLHSCNCAYDIPQSTTARSKRVDPR